MNTEIVKYEIDSIISKTNLNIFEQIQKLDEPISSINLKHLVEFEDDLVEGNISKLEFKSYIDGLATISFYMPYIEEKNKRITVFEKLFKINPEHNPNLKELNGNKYSLYLRVDNSSTDTLYYIRDEHLSPQFYEGMQTKLMNKGVLVSFKLITAVFEPLKQPIEEAYFLMKNFEGKK